MLSSGISYFIMELRLSISINVNCGEIPENCPTKIGVIVQAGINTTLRPGNVLIMDTGHNNILTFRKAGTSYLYIHIIVAYM